MIDTILYWFRLVICIILAPDAVRYLAEAESEVTNTSILLDELEAHLSLMERDILALLEKAAFIRNTSSDGITLMNEAFSNGE